jgi:putative acetyltransferase
MQIRRLLLAEMEEAARVHRASFDERPPWLAGLYTPEGTAQYFRERVFAEGQVWRTIESGRIVGIVAFTLDWINQLYVLPEAQGRGIGSRLLSIARADTDRVRLWTFQRNDRARRFYEAKGFIAVKLTDGSENHELEPAVLYKWSNR